jgi:predicted transcriptional regulator of viral defense system
MNKYVMNILNHRKTGLGKLDRERLAAILRETKGTITNEQASHILGINAGDASKMLSRWNTKGWLSRVTQGLYVPVALEASGTTPPLEDAWQVAAVLYDPCYIGGWSAAEYWDLTEQIFRSTVVMTTQTPRNRKPVLSGSAFLLTTVSKEKMFGLKTVWRDQVKVSVSDPSRTIIDMLSDPRLGGGIRSVQDMFRNYLQSEAKDLPRLIAYADQLGNGAVFKRLGFLLEKNIPEETSIMAQCLDRLTKGNARIDPKLPATTLITKWRLLVPQDWKEGVA